MESGSEGGLTIWKSGPGRVIAVTFNGQVEPVLQICTVFRWPAASSAQTVPKVTGHGLTLITGGGAVTDSNAVCGLLAARQVPVTGVVRGVVKNDCGLKEAVTVTALPVA